MVDTYTFAYAYRIKVGIPFMEIIKNLVTFVTTIHKLASQARSGCNKSLLQPVTFVTIPPAPPPQVSSKLRLW